MTNWKKSILLIFGRILLLMLVFTISRLFYLFINIDSAGNTSIVDILKLLLFGSRFDYTSIIYYNSLFLALSILPFYFVSTRAYKLFLKILFVLVNSLLILADLGDAIYFQFSNKRTTFDIFSVGGVGNDFFNLLPSYIIDFWYVFILWFGVIFLLIYLYPESKQIDGYKRKNYSNLYLSTIKNLLVYVLVIVLLVLPARGIGLKPIRTITAASYVSAEYIPFVLNTPFTMVTSYKKEELPLFNYLPYDEVKEQVGFDKSYRDSTGFQKKNVVIIILESFGKEYIGHYNQNKGYTPFLDSLIENGLDCSKAFANGTKSIDALPAVLAGLPSLLDMPYITSQYSSNKILGLGKLLSNKGYHTSFFHGGVNGTMGFDHFSRLAGFENYYGLNEYPNKEDFDGKWGIFDEEFYGFFNKKLSEFNQPFVSCIFSLSSHHPYKIPEKHKGKFKEGTLKIHQSILYADYALKTFFESAKKEDWFDNTVFVITADHTSKSDSKKYKTSFGNYSIPLILYNPSDSTLKGTLTQSVSQMDIMSTVLDYLNYEDSIFSFGSSILESSQDNFAIVKYSSVYQIFNNDTTYRFNGVDFTSIYAYKGNSLIRKNLLRRGLKVPENIDRSVKAFIQDHNFRIRNNKLTFQE